jgi:two-component system, LuxR family, response regulator DctR
MPTMTTAIGLPTVYLVDDEEVVRDALAWLLRSRRLLSESFGSGEAYLEFLKLRLAEGALPWPNAPSCLVLDVRMPGLSGLALFEQLIDLGLLPLLPVIFLTGHADVPTAVAAVKRGAFDFVEKPFSNNALVDRVEQALEISRQALLVRAQRERREQLMQGLTERELDVMHQVIEGRPNKLIADALGISVRTVEVHRAHVFEKMGVKSAVELANLLRSTGEGGAAA